MENKQKGIIAGIVLVLLVVITVIFFINSSSGSTEQILDQEDIEIIEDIMPVDDSVIVSVTLDKTKNEIELSISEIPVGTTSVEYEMSYDTEEQGFQGVIGEVPVESIDEPIVKAVTAGTCSSGKCVYHAIVGSIEVRLLFHGDYGKRIFENEFDL